MKVGIVACSASKINRPALVRELYAKSALFRYALNYCEKHYEKTYVVSAKYGLLELDQTIKPYNTTLNLMRAYEIREWASKTAEQIKAAIPIGSEIYFHAGAKYCVISQYLLPEGDEKAAFTIFEPMKEVGGIGKQLKFYKDDAGAKIEGPK